MSCFVILDGKVHVRQKTTRFRITADEKICFFVVRVEERRLGISGINVTDSRPLLRLCRLLEVRPRYNFNATLRKLKRPKSSSFIPRCASRISRDEISHTGIATSRYTRTVTEIVPSVIETRVSVAHSTLNAALNLHIR